MDAVFPTEATGAANTVARTARRGRAPYSVRWAEGELPVVELTPTGFVVEAEAPPHLRGFTDIFQGDERVLHGLVVCSWARDGLVGYEFKRGGSVGPIRADHVPPAHDGLLSGPKAKR